MDKGKQDNVGQRKRVFYNFLINNLLLFFGLIMIVSGLILQLGFHAGESGEHHFDNQVNQSQSIHYEQLRGIDASKIVWGFNYSNWSATHKFAIVIFSFLMIYHFYVHLKWYKVVITKHLINKNRQVIILSVLFLLVAATGLVPWFIDLSGSTSILRLLFIEIHDKIALILLVYLILHFIKRKKWFNTTYVNLKQ
jgi:hypothetical protein